MDIVLASGSKRRREILASCGIKYRVVVSGVKEIVHCKSPSLTAMFNARLKAEAVSKRMKSGYVIGADTVVLLNKKIIGKPRDAKHAKQMLKAMSGKSISVWTGLCVINVKTGQKVLDYEKSIVKVKRIKPEELNKYFKQLGPYDKAGGFSIEGIGSIIFDNIKGSYFNILGLPMGLLNDILKRFGIDLVDIIDFYYT